MVTSPKPENTVELTREGIRLGGRYEVLLCGSLFYFRLPRAVWRDRIRKLKHAGYNCVDVYFPWNFHELPDGTFDFEGERDVRCFLSELQAAGLYVIARPGPYICSEWNGGAIPARILDSSMPIRCADEGFLAEVERWFHAILSQISPFTYGKGGNIILLQLENELDFFDCPAPEAYISRLLELARRTITDIPCFCCAGQYDVKGAGGFTAGVEATMNCYPDSLDSTFDPELAGYARRFAELGKPLLVSETNRDHFLLRRELSCGAKLLGAYNQVAGIDFDYNQAINNWGIPSVMPDSMMATLYDFESMIDPMGGYHEEAEEAALFSAFLRTMNEALAGALPEEDGILPERCDFVTTAGGLRALSLMGGGKAVCVPNFSGRGQIALTCGGKTLTAEVLPARAPFFLFDYPLARHGIPAILTRTNCEPIRIGDGEIVLYTEGRPFAGLDLGRGEELFTADGETHGVRIRFVGREEALRLVTGGEPIVLATYGSRPLGGFRSAELPKRRPVPVPETPDFGALALREGSAEYSLSLPKGSLLFIERPCDLMRVDADGKRGSIVYTTGRDVIVPPSEDGSYTVCIEKWGHCNFDDPQSPALRTSGKKGARFFGSVRREEKIGRCDFCLLEKFGQERIPLGEGFPIRLAVDKWNTTRKPAVCAYTFPAERTADRLILRASEEADVAVYVDGALAGVCEFGSFDLTQLFGRGQRRTVTACYRKRVWTQKVGELRLLHIDEVKPKAIRVLSAREMCAMGGRGEELTLPLTVEGEAALLLEVPAAEESIVHFAGKNVKLTCVSGGRVVGRLFVGWEGAPDFQGGSPEDLYFNPAWGKEVRIFAEAAGENARLDGAKLIETR